MDRDRRAIRGQAGAGRRQRRVPVGAAGAATSVEG